MISIYDKNTANFNNNGLVVLSDSMSCNIAEELNGSYELGLEYPLDERGKWKYLTEDNIVKADGQLFRIYRRTKTLAGIKVYARHIFYDLSGNFVENLILTDKTGTEALTAILSSTQYTHNFTGSGDLSSLGSAIYSQKNPIEILLGDKGIISVWGGELKRDNFSIQLLNTRGADRGVLISYGKNIQGIEEDLDITEIYTRFLPVGKDGLMLPEKYVDSPNVGNYPYPRILPVSFNDIDTEDALRSAINAYIAKSKVDQPSFNYKIDFIELSKTEEYKNYSTLFEAVSLGDTVTIRHSRLNIDLKAKVIRTDKNCLVNRIEKIELGSFKSNTVTSLIATIQDLHGEIAKATDYIGLQYQEIDTTLTGLSDDISKFSSDGYISLAEAKALKNDLQKVVTESADYINIAIALEITDEEIAYANAIAALQTELNTNWIDQPKYPIAITPEERTHIESLFSNAQKALGVLKDKIDAVKDDNSKSYVASQVTELNTALSALQAQLNVYISAGKIEQSESVILDTLSVNLQHESDDATTIAEQLKPLVEGTDLRNLTNAEAEYISAVSGAREDIGYLIGRGQYPYTIQVSKGKEYNNKLKLVETTKNTLESLITSIRSANELTYTDEQVFEANVAIVALKLDITNFAADNWITLTESQTLSAAYDKINSESNDVVNVATSLAVDPTLITAYQDSITVLGTELANWVSQPVYPLKMTTPQKKSLLDKFKAVLSSESKLSDAISLLTPEYSVNGELYAKGTGGNKVLNRVLKINKKQIYNTNGDGLRLTVINRGDLSVVAADTKVYATSTDDQARLDLAAKLSSLDDTVIVVLTSYGSIGWNQALLDAMASCGGSGKDTGIGKIPFAFVGIPGLFKGCGLEVISDAGTKSPPAEISTKIIDGTPQGLAINGSVISAKATLALQQAIAEFNSVIAALSKVVNTSNNVVSTSEKKTVKKYWDSIVAEKPSLETNANEYNLTNYPAIGDKLASYGSAYTSLSAYITPILADSTHNSTVVSNTFLTTFSNYYQARIDLLTEIATVAKDYISDAVAGLAGALSNLGLDINSAFDDGFITEKEASDLALKLNELESESTPLIDLANSLGLDKSGDTEKKNYQDALTALANSLSPFINQDKSKYSIAITADEKTLVGTCFSGVQNTKTLLINKLASVQIDNAKAVVSANLVNFVNTLYSSDSTSFQSQSDGKIECWFYSYPPGLDNFPSNSWNSSAIKNYHLGDYFFDISSGKVYKFTLSSGYQWTQVTDPEVIQALYDSSKLQGSLDRSLRIFTNTPTSPYSIQDLWRGVSGDLNICIASRQNGTYKASDWISSSEYTDSVVASITKALADQSQADSTSALESLEDIADGNKITKSEKIKTLKPIWDAIVSEKANIDAQVFLYPSTTMTGYYGNYTDAFSDLDDYLNHTILSGNSSPILSDLTVTSVIIRSDYDMVFNNYYNSKNTLLNYIATSAKAYADTVYPTYGVLDNESAVIATDSAGNNGIYSGAITRMYVYSGSNDDSDNWTVTATPSAGVTGSLLGKTYTVTNMTVDTGYVDLTASRSGYTNVTKRFSLAKSKAGLGQDATSYWLVTDPAISKSSSGVYIPSSLTISAKSQTGKDSPTAYLGRFKIETSTDGTSYSTVYTSSSNESSTSYTIPAGLKALRVSLYLKDGTSTLLDQQVVHVVSDGANGTNGINGTNGSSSYFHVKYSDDGGQTFTSNSGETPGAYMGTYTDSNPTDSMSVSAYTWVKILDTTALAMLNNIASDSVLTPTEKVSLKREWDVIKNEYSIISSEAMTKGLMNWEGVRTANFQAYYNSYHNGMYDYLEGLLSSLTSQSSIVRTDFNNYFATYYNCKLNLMNDLNQYSQTGASDGRFDKTTTAPSGSTRLNYSGNFYATKVFNAYYADYAEYFLKDEEIEAGDVVTRNPEGEGYIKSRKAYDNLVVGVLSDDFAQCIGGEGGENDSIKYASVGMAGRVRVKVTGKVEIGDLLVSSPIEGVAMASEQYIHGTVIGKALESHSGDGIDRISMLVMMI